MQKLIRGAVIGSFLFFGACASVPKEYVSDRLTPEAPRAQKLPVEFIRQEKNMCGPSVLKMATSSLAPQFTLEKLKEMSFREDAQGTFKSDLLSASRRMGLTPYRVRTLNGMLKELQQNRPVIVFQNLGLAWLPVWHFALLVGYDGDENIAYLHSGETAYEKMPFHRFADSWRRGESWSYVVTLSTEIPQDASFDEALDNAMLLEHLQKNAEAQNLYQAMAKKWSDRFEPHLGLANLFYQRRDLRKALQESELALSKNPQHSALLFNLASLYHESGQREKAQQYKDRMLATAPEAEKEEYIQRLGF